VTERDGDAAATGRGPLIRQLGGALIAYLLLAYILTSSTWADPTNRWIGICCDQEQSVWFLAWLPTALELGQNPLLTDRLNAPDGVNLMWNTPHSLMALLAAPITRSAGPVLAYNVIVVLALALSGLACFAALRRYADRPLGPLVGGGLYAFSPYLASHADLHLSLVSAWAPPLFLLLLDELLVRRRWRAEVVGIAMGIVGALQLLTFEEVLATSAVAGALLALVLAVVARDRIEIGDAVRHAVRAVIPGLAAFLLIGGFPLAVQFLGPQQIHGRVQDASVFSTDLLNAVIPTGRQLIAPEAATTLASRFSGLHHEATGYVGLPLLAVLVGIVVAWRHDRRVLIAGVMAVAMFVFSLGPQLTIGGNHPGIPMPWLPFSSLPLLEHALPGRLTLYMWLAIAGLVALGIDHALGMDRRGAVPRLAAVGLALVFVLPAPLASSTHEVPAFFRSWSTQGISEDEIILFAPWFYNGAGADPMLWAAVAEARPRMHEGYAYVPDREGRPRYGPPAGPVARLMSKVQDDGIRPVITDVDRPALLRDLAESQISIVIVGPLRYRDEMVALFTDLLGEPPVDTAGVQLWRDVPGLLARQGVAEP
jgi:hypothetical protein